MQVLDDAARLTDLELQLDQLTRLDDEGLDDFLRVYIKDIGPEYEGDIQAFIDSQRRLRENEAINDELNKYGFADLTIDEIIQNWHAHGSERFDARPGCKRSRD